MLQNEFEERTKLSVTAEEYVKIDALYMACGDIDKNEFCEKYMTFEGRLDLMHMIERELNHKNQMYNRLKKEIAESVEEEELHKHELADFLLAEAAFHMCGSLTAKRLRDKAVELAGETSVVRMKIEHGYDLWQDDKDYILR
ncbi:MAG: hypothetical protein J5965_21235, partial [Aeriscardovia sp.]|nr:hypothetical protein [Aeriscardovia sp.]